MYKFVRIKDGDLRGTYHHPLFLRGRLDLVQLVRRNDKKEDHIHGKVTTPDDTDMIGIKRTLPRRNAGAAVHKRRMTDAFVKGEVATEDSEQEFELFDFSGDEAVADQSDEEQHDSEIMLGNAHRIEFLDEGVDCIRSLAVPALSFAPSSMLHSDGSKGDPSSADASSVERCHFKCSFDYRQGGLTGGSPMALSTFGSTASIPDDILEEIIKTFHVSSSSATDQARHSTNTTRMYW